MSENTKNIPQKFSEVTVIDDDTIKITLFDLPIIQKFTLLVREGQYFSKGARILKFFLNDTDPKNQRPRFICSPIYGKLLKYDADNRTLVLEKCKHESFYYNLCSLCNFDKSKNKDLADSYSNYSSLHSFLTFTSDKAKKEELNKVSNYLASKKLILLLDLDNTILHTCSFHMQKDEYLRLKTKYNDFIALLPIRKELDPSSHDKIIVKFRPHLDSFFSSLLSKYEIYTYTHGTKEYASGIIQYVSSKIAKDSLSLEKLIARENGKIESKTIKKVFPTNEDMVIIVDDRTTVWTENDENLINCHPYAFFYDEFLNNIPKRYYDEDNDNSLFCITKLLLFVHREFYGYYERNNLRKSVKIIINEKLNSIFNGLKFMCSGVYNKNNEMHKMTVKSIINKLGGELIENAEEEADILLVPEYIKTLKVSSFTEKNKIILHASYIDFCYMFIYKLDYEPFIINSEKKNIAIDIGKLFTDHKEKIENFYS